MYIIDGKKIREEILAEIKQEVARLPFTPLFCDVLVGNDFVSKKYVKMKAQIARSLGIDFNDASFPATITTEELVKEIKKLNQIKNMCGIIIQLPLPESIDRRAVLDAIDPELDVDCLGSVASENFYKGQVDFGFPTALACVAVLDSLNLDLKEKKIVVLGQGELVGKPTMAFLRLRGLFPIAVDRSTENKETIIKAVKRSDLSSAKKARISKWYSYDPSDKDKEIEHLTPTMQLQRLQKEMEHAVKEFKFEKAMYLREQMLKLRKQL